MKYALTSLVTFAIIILGQSCGGNDLAKAQSFNLFNCSVVGSGIERCENSEVICYIVSRNGISCVRR